MKLNKNFNDAEFKNCGMIVIFPGYGPLEGKYYADKEHTKELTLAEVKKLFLTGKLALQVTSDIFVPCGFNDDGLIIPNVAYPNRR